jgi:tellurium resistance protein TerD
MESSQMNGPTSKPTIQKGDVPVRLTLPLSKVVPEYHFRLTWDPRVDASPTVPEFDLDAVAFLLGADGQVAQRRSQNMVFYNNHLLTRTGDKDISPDESTELGGDNRIGGDDGELIKIRVARIAPSVHRIVLAVTIYDAENRQQTFGMVSNARVEILSVASSGHEHSEGSWDLSHESPGVTGLVFGQLVRVSDGWHFDLVSHGYTDGLREIGRLYGIEFSD